MQDATAVRATSADRYTIGVDFGTLDKVAISEALDGLGVDYVEGGWPGANPTDDAFFAAPPKLRRARLTAFGMTRRAGRSAENDPGLNALFSSGVRVLCLVGKTWDFNVETALGKNGTELTVDIRGKKIPTKVAKMPFVEPNYWRVPE